MQKNNVFEVDDMDTNLDNQIQMGLTDTRQREIMQKVASTDELLNQLNIFSGEYDNVDRNNGNLGTQAMEIDRCLKVDKERNITLTVTVVTLRPNFKRFVSLWFQ